MGRFQPFNDLPASQHEALKRDVEVRGIVNPILVDEHDKTIDGHQRRKVAAELGIECPRIVLSGLTADEKMSLAIALNTFRRHLTGVERSKALQQMALLGMSTRRIAEATGLSQRTVVRGLQSGESFDSPDDEAVSGVRSRTPDDSGAADAAPAGDPPTTGAEFIDRYGVTPDEAEAVLAMGGDKATLDEMRAANGRSPRVTGKDGKSYPAAKPKPVLTEEEQGAEDRAGQLRRAAHRLRQFVDGWIEFENFHAHPDRDEILALLIPHDRDVVLEVEGRFLIGADK